MAAQASSASSYLKKKMPDKQFDRVTLDARAEHGYKTKKQQVYVCTCYLPSTPRSPAAAGQNSRDKNQ